MERGGTAKPLERAPSPEDAPQPGELLSDAAFGQAFELVDGVHTEPLHRSSVVLRLMRDAPPTLWVSEWDLSKWLKEVAGVAALQVHRGAVGAAPTTAARCVAHVGSPAQCARALRVVLTDDCAAPCSVFAFQVDCSSADGQRALRALDGRALLINGADMAMSVTSAHAGMSLADAQLAMVAFEPEHRGACGLPVPARARAQPPHSTRRADAAWHKLRPPFPAQLPASFTAAPPGERPDTLLLRGVPGNWFGVVAPAGGQALQPVPLDAPLGRALQRLGTVWCVLLQRRLHGGVELTHGPAASWAFAHCPTAQPAVAAALRPMIRWRCCHWRSPQRR